MQATSSHSPSSCRRCKLNLLLLPRFPLLASPADSFRRSESDRGRWLFDCQADVQEGGEGQVDGAVRWAPLPALPPQLLHLPLVRPPLGLRRRQDARRHRQRHRRAVPARLHFALHLLRRQQEHTGNSFALPLPRLAVLKCSSFLAGFGKETGRIVLVLLPCLTRRHE